MFGLNFILPTVFVALPGLGIAYDMPWLALFAGAVIFPILEYWSQSQAAHEGLGKNSKQAFSTWTWGPWFPRGVLLYLILQNAYLLSNAQEWSWFQIIALGLSMGYISGGIGITLGHELGHRRNGFDRFLARTHMITIDYSHYIIEHNRGHHRMAAIEGDPASAREEESLWRFLPRYYWGVFKGAMELAEKAQGKFNEVWLGAILSLVFLAGVVYLAGIQGFVLWLINLMVAQFLVGAVDYIEHWGLRRKQSDGKFERMGPEHTWDSASTISEALLFNLPRHAAHHMEPSLHCDELYRSHHSPQMPTGYAGMILLAMIPPLFFKVMKPRLAQVKSQALA